MNEEIEKYKTILLDYVARDRAIRGTDNFAGDFDSFCEEKNHAIEQALREIDLLKRDIEIKNQYLSLITAIGCDYDGYDRSSDLKHLIDELISYAKKALDNDDTTPMYGAFGTRYNILMEEIK